MPRIALIALFCTANALPRLSSKLRAPSPKAAAAARLRGGGALGTMMTSVGNEIANRNASPAKLYGFYGA